MFINRKIMSQTPTDMRIGVNGMCVKVRSGRSRSDKS